MQYSPRYVFGSSPQLISLNDSVQGPVLDATRISDGAQVVLKIVRTGSMEVHISELLARHPGAKKHAVTVLEIIPVPDDIKWSFLVMPRMRVCNRKPDFKTVREFVEFLRQVLEVGVRILWNDQLLSRQFRV